MEREPGAESSWALEGVRTSLLLLTGAWAVPGGDLACLDSSVSEEEGGEAEPCWAEVVEAAEAGKDLVAGAEEVEPDAAVVEEVEEVVEDEKAVQWDQEERSQRLEKRACCSRPSCLHCC